MGLFRQEILLQKKEEMKILPFILFFTILGTATLFSRDAQELCRELDAATDFVVGLRGKELHEFDIGLGEKSREGGFGKMYVPRERCRAFFLKQKHKGMVLVKYNSTSLAGAELKAEADRTISYFKDAGYARIVLIRYFNQGVEIVYDSDDQQAAGVFVEYGK